MKFLDTKKICVYLLPKNFRITQSALSEIISEITETLVSRSVPNQGLAKCSCKVLVKIMNGGIDF